MSTHALTVLRTREWDGENVANVSHIWRKYDGYPTCHGGELVRILSGKEFISSSELIAETWSGLVTLAPNRENNWQFCPVLHSQRPPAEWHYSLSLRNKVGELPRGGPLMPGPFHVWLKVRHKRKIIYDGPLAKYVPDDDLEPCDRPTKPEENSKELDGNNPQMTMNSLA